jgi:hypothetical protein
MALIPRDLTQDTIQMHLMDEYTLFATQTRLQALEAPETPIQQAPDVTAWPVDAPRPPFAVGGVYTFADVYGRQRTALIYTEQHARVDGAWWHVSELPEDATFARTFTPDPALVADAARFAREVVNSQEWS